MTKLKKSTKPPSYARLPAHLAILFGFGEASFEEHVPGAVFDLYPWTGDAFDVLRDVYYPENWKVYLNQEQSYMVVTSEPLSLSGTDLTRLAALEHLGYKVYISGYAPAWPGERVLIAIGKARP